MKWFILTVLKMFSSKEVYLGSRGSKVYSKGIKVPFKCLNVLMYNNVFIDKCSKPLR